MAAAGTDDAPAAARRSETPRIRLARLTAQAALECDGVLSLDRGPRDHWSTFADGERLPGVVVMADDAPGRYAASVYLRAALTDLRALADEVRAAVRAAAEEQQLAEHLGEVRVAITDIDDEALPA